ncbi:MAG: hypothetical protein L0Z50_40995 [Verrucomicrobiales bacterium]|nr:hypothetical protein [Verrucomicrobiales bacterium]
MKTISKTIMYLSLAAILLTTALAGSKEKMRPFKGSAEALELYDLQLPTLFVDASGSGHATHLGQFTYTYEAIVNFPAGTAVGSACFIASNGDAIFAEFTGLGQATGTLSFIVEKFTITGGTGRFEGATGSFTMERLLNLVTGETEGAFKGTISY